MKSCKDCKFFKANKISLPGDFNVLYFCLWYGFYQMTIDKECEHFKRR